jgi:hypothetical protein
MNKDIKAAINKKKRLWKKSKQGSGMDEYKTADKKVKNMIRAAKRNVQKRLAYEKGGNSRPFYSYEKKETKSRSTIGPLKDLENKTVLGDRGVAELLNKFFSSVITREDILNVPSAETLEAPDLETVSVTHKLVREKIRNLSPSPAAGPDGIGPLLLQELQEELVPASMERFRMTGKKQMLRRSSKKELNRIQETTARCHSPAAKCWSQSSGMQ